MTNVQTQDRTLPDLAVDAARRLRQLRWFRHAFHATAKAFWQERSKVLSIDEDRLTEAFFAWLDALEPGRVHAKSARRDFVVYAAGLALRELIVARTVTTSTSPEHALACDLYVRFCLAGVAAVDLQETGHPRDLAACADDPRFWESLHENTAISPDAAVAFLDRLHGIEPNWEMPLSVIDRQAVRAALADSKMPAITVSS